MFFTSDRRCLLIAGKHVIWNTPVKDSIMPPFILLLLVLVIFVCAFGYMIKQDAQRRAREKKRNQYHDRV